jgi:uncharacterized protein YbjT (DUF2867 family)
MSMKKTLIIGASGRVGSEVIKSLEKNKQNIEIIYSTSNQTTKEKWEKEGKSTLLLDLNKPELFESLLKGIHRIFLLTGYSSEMLFQAKLLIDAAKKNGVEFIVHLGVYTSRYDFIPHFSWHDLIECYLNSSGIPFCNIHPNVITESVLITKPSIKETHCISTLCGDAKQGWVCTKDIGEVAATVLREGPEKHNGKDYYLSIEVLTFSEVAKILSDAAGVEIKFIDINKEQQEQMFNKIKSPGIRNYMESAQITMDLTRNGKFKAQNEVNDDVLTVVGRPGTKMKEWAKEYFNDNK